MAKRAAPDEQPYRPLLDVNLVSAALAQTPPPTGASPVKEIPVARVAPRISPEVSRPAFARPSEVKASGIAERQILSRSPEREAPQQELVEKFDQEKRILFTRTETQAIDRLV